MESYIKSAPKYYNMLVTYKFLVSLGMLFVHVHRHGYKTTIKEDLFKYTKIIIYLYASILHIEKLDFICLEHP